MTHLDDIELLEAIDGGSAGAPHLASCAACRQRADELSSLLAEIRSLDPPEPSPLFWEHFRARVADAVNQPPERPRIWTPAVRRLVAATALAALVIGGLIVHDTTNPLVEPDASDTPLVAAIADPEEDPDADEAWALVRSVAGEVDYEAVQDAGVAAAPGALDRAALALSAAEQAELVRLIEEELKRTDP